MTKLTIGILAHNEANVISTLLRDVSRQSVLQSGFDGVEVQICVVPNGCDDATAETSRRVLTDLKLPEHVTWQVVEVGQPSKTNAWNVFVHEIAPDDADYLLFLDADISLPQTDIIERSIATLEAHPSAWVASDQSRNVFPDGSGPSFMKLMAPMVAGTVSGGGHSICGQFYCARAQKLKQITLPVGLLSQDGFIRAMVLTSALTEPEQLDRVRLVPGAYHLHPAYTKLSSRFRYEKRQAMSTTVYTFVYQLLNRLPPSLDDRMAEIKRLNETRPNWVADIVNSETAKSMLPVPRRYVFKRVRQLQVPLWKAFLKKPVLIPAVMFDMFVCWRASIELKTQSIGTFETNKGRFKIRAQS